MASAASHIPEATWEVHRSEITRLYCDERKTQKEVEKFMREERGFAATKWQYETHFKAWSLKKNHSQGTWSALNRLVGETPIDRLSAPILYHGRPLSQRKVKKALSRYKNSTVTVPVNALSPGFVVPDSSSGTVPLSVAPTDTILDTSTPSIPSLGLDSEMPYSELHIQDWNIGDFYLQRPSWATEIQISQHRFPWNFKHKLFTQEQALLEVPEHSIHALQASSSFESRTVEGRLVSESRILPNSESSGSRAIFPASLLETWKLPSSVESSSYKHTHEVGKSQNADDIKFRVIIYALSNNLADQLEFSSLGHMWPSLKQHFATMTNESILEIGRTSYSTSLCWKILQSAIEAGEADAVRQIIELWHINVNDVSCHGRGAEKLTAVELACGFLHSDVLDVLLDAGADANSISAYTQESCRTEWRNHELFKLKKLNTKDVHLEAGGAFYWVMRTHKLESIFQSRSIHFTARNVQQVLRIVHRLIRAGMRPHPPALHEIFFQNATAGSWWPRGMSLTEELRNISIFTVQTPLDWLLKILILRCINEAHQSRCAPFEKPPFTQYVLELVQLCGSQGHDGPASTAQLFRSLIRKAESMTRFNLAVHYLAYYGRTLGVLAEQFPCGHARCIHIFTKDVTHETSAPMHDRLLSLLSLIRTGNVADSLVLVEAVQHAGNRRFWKSLLRDGACHEDDFLENAINAQSEVLIRKVLEIRQYPLHLYDFLSEHELEHNSLLLSTSLALFDWEDHFELCEAPDLPTPENILCDLWSSSEAHLAWLCEAIGDGDCARIQQLQEFSYVYPWESKEIARALGDVESPSLDAVINMLMQPEPEPSPTTKALRWYTPLLAAARRGHLGIANQLIAREPNVHALIREDKDSKYVSILGALIQEDTSTNQRICQSVIQGFCQPYQIDLAAEVLNKDYGPIFTPLLIAIRRGIMSLVELLVVDYKADVNFAPVRGVRRTPLQQAAESGHYDIAEWLISRGAHVNGPINQHGGATALQLASIGGYCGLVEMLIHHGADLNAASAALEGRTALEGAAEHGRLHAVGILLDNGVNITGDGMASCSRAVRYARKNGHISVAELLESSYTYQSSGLGPLMHVDGPNSPVSSGIDDCSDHSGDSDDSDD